VRPGEPYPAAFRSFQWTDRELNPPCRRWTGPPRQGGVVPLDHQPGYLASVDLMGVEPIAVRAPPQLAPSGMQARIIKRSVRESNPVFVLTTDACGREHLQTTLSK
jgi:hypothetical protein